MLAAAAGRGGADDVTPMRKETRALAECDARMGALVTESIGVRRWPPLRRDGESATGLLALFGSGVLSRNARTHVFQ